MRAVILDTDSLGPRVDFAPLTDCYDNIEFLNVADKAQTIQAVKSAEVIISNKVVIDREVIEGAPSLKRIQVAATGYNNVDLQTCHERGIGVCNVRAYGTASVSQHTWALILALSNRVIEHHQQSINGQWSESPWFCTFDHRVNELEGKVLTIIGGGELGSAVGKIAEAFGMRVQFAGRKHTGAQTGRVPFNQAISTADVITLHCPLNADTANLISTPEFKLMKPSSLLVNTARGGIVDEAALIEALQNAQIAGAAFDVLTTEPPSSDHPLLQNIPNLIITPHVAWASIEARQRIIDQMADIERHADYINHNYINAL
ncbi:MAG: D-2-hydroxyacid dehydrogenase [Gammaproteobacteria bacterium]|nr:D-2-hydroxyacid dehydrogenase [Gammaproteobacteria bacterium]